MTIQNWKRGRYGSISLKSKVSSIAVEDKGATGVTRNGAHWTFFVRVLPASYAEVGQTDGKPR